MSRRPAVAPSPTRLVLLHGFAGSPAMWRPVLEHLPAELQAGVWAPALAGHGAPPPLPGPGSFEAEVERLAGALETRLAADGAAGPRPCLAGYSLGGRLALGLLHRRRELFGTAVLIGANPGLADDAERTARRAADEAWARRLETEGLEAFLDAWEAQPLFASQGPDQRRQLRLERAGLDPHGLAAALRSLGLAAMPDHRPVLETLDLPVALVAGEADAKFRQLAGEMAALLPSARVHIVPGVGHNVVLEAPRLLAEILRSQVLRAEDPGAKVADREALETETPDSASRADTGRGRIPRTTTPRVSAP